MKDEGDQAYKDIETQSGVSVATVKVKIGRETSKCNKTKSGQSVDEVYKSSWAVWDKMQFLCPIMQVGKSLDIHKIITITLMLLMIILRVLH